MANPLTYGLHYRQGRVTGGVSGSHCLCLGDIPEEEFIEMAGSEYVSYEQDVDVSDVDYITFWIRGERRDGSQLDIEFNGVTEYRFSVWGDEDLPREEFMPVSINVSGLTGTKKLKFVLVPV